MKINALRSDDIYRKIMSAPLEKKNDIFRYEMMKPFEKKWDCYN
ncbi:MAG: Zn-dependent protease, partial [Oscillospiraceae bacterium]|nr:Zn-dependent protease [Oscillospiraceae bacterium]